MADASQSRHNWVTDTISLFACLLMLFIAFVVMDQMSVANAVGAEQTIRMLTADGVDVASFDESAAVYGSKFSQPRGQVLHQLADRATWTGFVVGIFASLFFWGVICILRHWIDPRQRARRQGPRTPPSEPA
ncbi:MAG: hypothetical protein AAF747_08255 [Planctomycetota bacterium]